VLDYRRTRTVRGRWSSSHCDWPRPNPRERSQ
jgi:hypothetical protein